ncbi:MAG: hypothetical protein ACI9HK_005361, partial [Pirellulaceae bacterium]
MIMSKRTKTFLLSITCVAACLLVMFADWTRSNLNAAPQTGIFGRYVARFADGSRLEGTELTDLHLAQPGPKLDGTPLTSPSNPYVWLRDRRLTAGDQPSAMVEMIGGDRLPGMVIGLRREAESFADPTRPYFLVRPHVAVDLGGAQRETVRVFERFVRRVVWQRRENGATNYEPGVAFFRDGSNARFRAVRFGADFALLLVEGGTRRATFDTLAEIHLSKQDPWETYYDELAVLDPDNESRLFQVETSSGLLATSSESRSTVGGSNANDAWYALRPAWSLDTFWIMQQSVCTRQMFAPHQVPLNRVQPTQVDAQDRVANWRVNRNAFGGPMVSGGLDRGWGFGVHSVAKLYLPLPTTARSLRISVGLDAQAGSGGCARARIRLNSNDEPLYESPLLLGKEKGLFDSGPIPLPASDDATNTLVLEVDPVHLGRPPGADPFDIRDVINWVEPILELDPAKLRTEIRRRLGRQVLAWDNWNLQLDPAGTYTFTNVLSGGAASQKKIYRAAVHVHDTALKLSREIEIDAQHRWLVVFAHRNAPATGPIPADVAAAELEIRVDDKIIASMPVPISQDEPPAPLMVDLASYRGRKVNIQITQAARPALPPVQWQAVSFNPHPPMLYPLFEDFGSFASADDTSPKATTTAKVLPFSGQFAARIPAKGFYTLNMDEPIRVRENPQWGEYRHLQFAIRKPSGGQICLELRHENSDAVAVRYDAGVRNQDAAAQDFVWFDDELPLKAVALGSEAAESWHWVSGDGNPVLSGKTSVRRQAKEFGQHNFTAAEPGLEVNTGDKLFTYVYLDPNDPPRQIMLEWNTGQWIHRAYWGESLIAQGVDGTTTRICMGALPKTGEWVRLEVDVTHVGLRPGAVINGWAMTQFGGTIWWDKAGVRSFGKPPYGIARRSWPMPLPDDWIVITRDLFADYGELNVTGLTLHVPAGGHAFVDHVFLARTQEGFAFTGAPAAESTNFKALRPRYRRAFEDGVSATVTVEIGGRRGTGVLVGNAGHVLTAGHLIIGETK